MKDRELIAIQEKCAHVEMEREQLEDKLKRIKVAESWEKMSPRSSITGEPFSPFVSGTSNLCENDLLPLHLLGVFEVHAILPSTSHVTAASVGLHVQNILQSSKGCCETSMLRRMTHSNPYKWYLPL